MQCLHLITNSTTYESSHLPVWSHGNREENARVDLMFSLKVKLINLTDSTPLDFAFQCVHDEASISPSHTRRICTTDT